MAPGKNHKSALIDLNHLGFYSWVLLSCIYEKNEIGPGLALFQCACCCFSIACHLQILCILFAYLFAFQVFFDFTDLFESHIFRNFNHVFLCISHAMHFINTLYALCMHFLCTFQTFVKYVRLFIQNACTFEKCKSANVHKKCIRNA